MSLIPQTPLLLLLAACAGPTPGDSEPTETTETTTTIVDTSPTTTNTIVPCGKVDRVLHLKGVHDDEVWAAAAMSDGGVVITGGFARSLTFGEGEPNETELTSQSGAITDMFLARYAADASLMWVKHGMSTGVDRGHYLSVNASDQIAVSGMHGSAFQLDEEQPALTHTNIFDVFVAVFASDGMLEWASASGSISNDMAGGVALADDGAVYLQGTFPQDLTVAMGSPEETVVASGAQPYESEERTFLAKYAPGGQLEWVTSILGEGYGKVGTSVALVDGGVLSLGEYAAEAIFAPNTPQETTLVPEAGKELWLAAYDTAGQLLWVKGGGSPQGGNFGHALVAHSDGPLLVGEVGPDASLPSNGGLEVLLDDMNFAAEYTETGQLVEVHTMISPSDAIGFAGVAAQENGLFALSGRILYPMTVGIGDDAITHDTGPEHDAFLGVWDGEGGFACAWFGEGDSGTEDGSPGVAFDGQGGLWWAGQFGKNMTFNAGTEDEVTLTSSDQTDIFLAHVQLQAE